MKIHVVRQGDTLITLSQKYNVPVERLLEANPDMEGSQDLSSGGKVRVPTGKISLHKNDSVTSDNIEPLRDENSIQDVVREVDQNTLAKQEVNHGSSQSFAEEHVDVPSSEGEAAVPYSYENPELQYPIPSPQYAYPPQVPYYSVSGYSWPYFSPYASYYPYGPNYSAHASYDPYSVNPGHFEYPSSNVSQHAYPGHYQNPYYPHPQLGYPYNYLPEEMVYASFFANPRHYPSPGYSTKLPEESLW